MFKLDVSDSYLWPVKVEMPGADGAPLKGGFEAEFKRVGQSRVEELNQKLRDGSMSDRELLREVFVGWREVCSADGAALPFGTATRDRLLEIFPIQPAVVKAWFASLETGREKN